MGFHRHLGVVKPWWHQRSTWSPKLSHFWRLGRHGGKANLTPQKPCGAENLTVNVSPGILCALVMFGVRAGVAQLFLSQNQDFSPKDCLQQEALPTWRGFSSGSSPALSRGAAEPSVAVQVSRDQPGEGSTGIVPSPCLPHFAKLCRCRDRVPRQPRMKLLFCGEFDEDTGKAPSVWKWPPHISQICFTARAVRVWRSLMTGELSPGGARGAGLRVLGFRRVNALNQLRLHPRLPPPASGLSLGSGTAEAWLWCGFSWARPLTPGLRGRGRNEGILDFPRCPPAPEQLQTAELKLSLPTPQPMGSPKGVIT